MSTTITQPNKLTGQKGRLESGWASCYCLQDALLEEEGATPADAFGGDANPVSLRLPQAKAETKQRMQTAEEAHEVSKSLHLLPFSPADPV